MLEQMTNEELMRFHDETRAHPVKAARRLFDGLPVGAVAAARDLAHYAANLATAKSLQAEEQTAEADVYRQICQRIRADLPEYALPLLGEDTPGD